DAIVLGVDDGDMAEIARTSRLRGRVQVARPLEACAAGDPLARLAFTEDDRIEDLAILALHRDDAAAALFQVRQRYPCFQRLRLQIARQWLGANEGGLAVELQPAMFDHRAAAESSVQSSDTVAGILLEGPARE